MLQRVVDAFRLRFPAELEREFREEYYAKSLNALRLSLLLGAILYGLFGVLDHLIFPETRNAVWIIRYGFACPAIMACLAFTYVQSIKRYMQPVIFATVVLCGGCIIAMMAVVRSPINYIHNAGLLLVLMYVFTFSKLRFSYTMASSWMIVAMYEIAAIAVMRTPPAAILYDNYLFVSANLIGMFSLFHRERSTRRDFLYSRMVRELEEKRHILEREKILRDLHDGIGGITTNIRLLAEMNKDAVSIEEIRKTLTTISELSREALAELKGFMQSMDIRELTWPALATELKISGRSLVEPHGFDFAMSASLDTVDGQPASLLWLNLTRIYKEALTNVVKHSRGRSVTVIFAANATGLTLEVHDDGSGFLHDAGGGRGLSNMRKRAEEIGGAVTHATGKGTTVRFELPLPIRPRSPGDAVERTQGFGQEMTVTRI